MAIKKVKLNYMPVVVRNKPAEKTIVPGSHIDALNRSIKQKVRQNEAERAASMEAAGRYMVR